MDRKPNRDEAECKYCRTPIDWALLLGTNDYVPVARGTGQPHWCGRGLRKPREKAAYGREMNKRWKTF
jgi:hypothetical protein